MLGQKILDSFPEIDHPDGQYSLPDLPTGLTIRRQKSAGLRIVTERDALWPESSSGDPTSLCPPPHNHSYLSVRTPDTSHTFGRPNPSMISPKHPPSALASTPASPSPSTAILAARRLSRYSQAESALRSAVETSAAEQSPQELQIRVLEKATAMLSEQARDAQACAVKLRAWLAVKGEKGLSPEEVKSLQREYWMEERRSSARQGQSALTRDLVTKLCSPISEVPPPLMHSPAIMSRQEANFAKFMQLLPTRVAFPTHTRSASMSSIYTPRRQTISQVRPMRLRASALELALRSPIQSHRRSRSLDGSHSRRNSDSTDATFVEDAPDEQTAVPLSNALHLKLPPSPLMSEPTGVVRIEKTGPHRDHDALAAEVGDVTLPDYAVNLLEDLVASSLDIALPSLIPSPSVPPPRPDSCAESPPPELPPRHSSSVPDFALTIPDLNLNLSLTDPSSTSSSTLSPPSPPSPSLPLSPPQSLPPFLGRLRSTADTPSATSFPPVRLRCTTPNAHARPSATQSLHTAQAGSLSKLSLHGLTSPSLVTVPEAESAGLDGENRPQTSMSGYALVESESAVEDGAAQGEQRTVKRRFSLTSFRRRRRLHSQGSVTSVGAEEGVGAEMGLGLGKGASRASPKKGDGVALAHGEHGILARFKRRFSGIIQ